jgi:superfamily II DNA helicase RecQ
MGVDTPTVHRIVHLGSPHNLVDYIQGVGRSGRDGQTLFCFSTVQKGPETAKMKTFTTETCCSVTSTVTCIAF